MQVNQRHNPRFGTAVLQIHKITARKTLRRVLNVCRSETSYETTVHRALCALNSRCDFRRFSSRLFGGVFLKSRRAP
jgi:hypothetical protein